MKIELYTDGSYKHNLGMGGYAAYLPDKQEVVCGYSEDTTNNRMELQAVISGLRNIDSKNNDIIVYTDSQYVCRGISDSWLTTWKNNGWKTKQKKQVKNQDLWEELDSEISKFDDVTFKWVKGHSSNYNNNLCDIFATAVIGCK